MIICHECRKLVEDLSPYSEMISKPQYLLGLIRGMGSGHQVFNYSMILCEKEFRKLNTLAREYYAIRNKEVFFALSTQGDDSLLITLEDAFKITPISAQELLKCGIYGKTAWKNFTGILQERPKETKKPVLALSQR
ncbi:MAG: hypothetical protein AABW88_04460 [Nanoarchaeota archaeon]